MPERGCEGRRQERKRRDRHRAARAFRKMTADGRLAENVMHFARVLRAAGLPIGPDRVLDAVRALEVAGVERREDFYWTLASVFLGRREQFEIYDQAFHIFWRDPQLLERVMAMLLPPRYGQPRRNAEPSVT